MAAMARDCPEETDRVLLASLKQCSRFSERRPPTDDPYTTFQLRGYEFSEGHDAARQLLETAMIPADREVLASALTRLRYLTASRHAGDADLKFMASAYLEALADCPGDAVMAALQRWPREHKFWPALAELLEATWAGCERRKMLQEALCERC
jgi:hypothetical protein